VRGEARATYPHGPKIGRSVGLTDAEAEGINALRDKTPAEPMSFE